MPCGPKIFWQNIAPMGLWRFTRDLIGVALVLGEVLRKEMQFLGKASIGWLTMGNVCLFGLINGLVINPFEI
jgi:hypothetical protein